MIGSEIDAPPSPAERSRAGWWLAGFVALQALIPLRYYLGDDLYDERFAWRMFSQVRVQECSAEASEDGRAISPYAVLPAPWVSLLSRNRPAVIGRFLAWRCAAEGARERVRVTTTCRDVTGEPLPPIVRERDCASGDVTVGGE